MTQKPRLSNSQAQNDLDKAEKQFEAFEESIQNMTLDRMNQAPKQETEPQTKLSQKDIERSKEIYLKPVTSITSRDKFNERFRADYEFEKEYVQFIAEHNELKGEVIETWTRPRGGIPAEFWKVPTNKPVWGPRYLAEQIKRKNYHRFVMQQHVMTHSLGGVGEMYGSMAVDTIIQRLDARPVSSKKSIFMGAA